MRSILYFALLFVIFGSSSPFAVEQIKRKKICSGRSVSSVHENVDIRKNLKQNAPGSTAQGPKPKSYRSSSAYVDKLNVEKPQGIKTEGAINKKELQHDENRAPAVEKTIDRDKRGDKDLGNNPPGKSEGEGTPGLPSVTDKEVNKNLFLPPRANSNEDVADLRKDLQVDKKIDVEENEPSEHNKDKLLEGRKEKEEDRAKKKEEVRKLVENHSRKNRIKPITRSDKENKQEKEKNLQRWAKLDREPIKELCQKHPQSKSVYKRQYDKLNEHLPTTVFIDDYSKQLFYCIKKNNLVCLRGIISKLEKLGLTIQEVLKLRNRLGDTSLIYAVKQGGIDVVRFLLLQGADPKAVNNSLQSPIDIAIERGRVDMINAITEMTPHLLEHKRIDNKESLEMHNWAVKTKENNKLQCSEDQER